MKQTIIILTVLSLITACGGMDKKAQLEALKKQQESLSQQIEQLEEEIKKDGGDSTKKKINLVQAAPITAKTFLTYIDVQGKVDADENVSISSEMPGTLIKISVKVGDDVTKGQVLAETDAKAIQQSISALQTSLDLVNQLYEKQKALWEQKVGTEVQYLQAKANKESLEKQLSTLQEQLRMTKIISPIDGTVDAIDVKLGQAVAPGFPAMRIVNFGNLKVKADLAESYIGRVKKGDHVKVYFPDTNDSTESVINYSSRSINAVTRTFSIEALLAHTKDYHPNMVSKIKINDYKSAIPVISVPVKLIQNDLNGEKFVFVAAGDKAVKKLIKTGHEYSGKIEILDGLKEGDRLITEGYDNINEGDLVSYGK